MAAGRAYPARFRPAPRDRYAGLLSERRSGLELTAVYVDFQDAASYALWRWLVLVPAAERVEVRPFSLDSAGEDGALPWDATDPSWALELLALGECARDAGAAVHRRFVGAAFAAVHGGRSDPADPETWLRLGTELGLDLDGYTGEGDRWRAEVGLWHREAVDEFGVDTVPVLVFDERRALHLVLDGEVDDSGAAERLLDDLAGLAAQPVRRVRRLP